MKRLLPLVLLFISVFANAESISLSFQEIPVVKLAEATYKSILKKDYILSPEVINAPEKITLSVTVDRQDLPDTIEQVLKSAGIKVEEKNDVFWISKIPALPLPAEISKGPAQNQTSTKIPDATTLVNAAKEAQNKPQEVFLYHPMYRKLDDLKNIAGKLATVVAMEDSLIFTGEPQKLDVVRMLLNEYDKKRDEVLAKVTVVEYSNDSDNGAGFFGALHLLGKTLNFQAGDSGTLDSFFRFKNNTIEAVLSVINQDSHFHVVSTSNLRIASGKTGKLSVGQEVPTLGKNDYDEKGNPVQSVFYREAGLIVNLTPTIVKDTVYTDITHEVSDFLVTKTSNIDSPSITKRSFSTNFSCDFGEIVFLGGLDEEKKNEANSGLFGFTFSQQKIESKTIIFLILEYVRV